MGINAEYFFFFFFFFFLHFNNGALYCVHPSHFPPCTHLAGNQKRTNKKQKRSTQSSGVVVINFLHLIVPYSKSKAICTNTIYAALTQVLKQLGKKRKKKREKGGGASALSQSQAPPPSRSNVSKNRILIILNIYLKVGYGRAVFPSLLFVLPSAVASYKVQRSSTIESYGTLKEHKSQKIRNCQ